LNRDGVLAAEKVRDALLARLGSLPSPVTPAAARVEKRFAIGGVIYERWRLRGPRDDIPAWFLVGEQTPAPAPTVIALHPHGRQFEVGKSQVAGLIGEPSRGYGLAAAKAGFAVLVPDLPGFEERRPPLAARKANYALSGEAYEKLLAMTALVRGETLQGWMIADISAMAGCLVLDQRVDGERLALIGQSYGGQQALFAMLFDPRFRAGICSCGFSLVRLLVERSILHNFALYLPGMLPDLDFDVLVPAIAPHPLTIIAGRQDQIFPFDGVEAVGNKAREAWTKANAPDALRLRYFDGGHDLPPAMLAESLDWLGKVLG